MHIHSLKAINERTTHYADLALLKHHFYRWNSLAEAFYYVKLWGRHGQGDVDGDQDDMPIEALA